MEMAWHDMTWHTHQLSPELSLCVSYMDLSPPIVRSASGTFFDLLVGLGHFLVVVEL